MKKIFLPFLLYLFAAFLVTPQYVYAEGAEEKAEDEPGALVGTGDMSVVITDETTYYIQGDEIETQQFNGTITGEFKTITFIAKAFPEYTFDNIDIKDGLKFSESGSLVTVIFKGVNEINTISVKGILHLYLDDDAIVKVTDETATLDDSSLIFDYTGSIRKVKRNDTFFTVNNYVVAFDFSKLTYDFSVKAESEWESKVITYQWQINKGSWQDIPGETKNTYSTADEYPLRLQVLCGGVQLIVYVDVTPPLDDIDPIIGTGNTSVNITGQYTYRNAGDIFIPDKIFNATATGEFALIRINSAQRDNKYQFDDIKISSFSMNQDEHKTTIHFTGENEISSFTNNGYLTLTREMDASLTLLSDAITLNTGASFKDYTGAVRQVSQDKDDFIITGVSQLYNPVDKKCDLYVKALTDWTSAITYQWQNYSEVNKKKEWVDIKNATKREYTADKDGDYRLLVSCGNATLSVYFKVSLDDIKLEPLTGEGGEDVIFISPYIYRYADEDVSVVHYFDGTVKGQFNSLLFNETRENTSCTFDNVIITDKFSISSAKAADAAFATIRLKGENLIQTVDVYGTLTLTADDEATLDIAKEVTVFKKGQLKDFSALLTTVKMPEGSVSKTDTDRYQYLENGECLLTVKGATTIKDPVIVYSWEKQSGADWKVIAAETKGNLLVKEVGYYRGLITCEQVVLSGVFHVFGPVSGAGIDAVVTDNYLVSLGGITTRYNNEMTGIYKTLSIAPTEPKDISVSIAKGSVINLNIDNKGQHSNLHIGEDMVIDLLQATSSSTVRLSGETFSEKTTIKKASISKSTPFLDYSGFIELLDVEGDTYAPKYPTGKYSTDDGEVTLVFGTETSVPNSVAYIDLQKYIKIENDSIWSLVQFGLIPNTGETELPEGVTKIDILKEFIVKEPGFYRACITLRGSNITFSTPPVFVDGKITGSATVPDTNIQIHIADGNLFIQLPEMVAQPKSVSIYDTLGKLHYQHPLSHELSIPLSEGIYIVRVGEESFVIRMNR